MFETSIAGSLPKPAWPRASLLSKKTLSYLYSILGQAES